jgi:hypothetical protein
MLTEYLQNLYSDESANGWSRYWSVLYDDQIKMWGHSTAEFYKVSLAFALKYHIYRGFIKNCL